MRRKLTAFAAALMVATSIALPAAADQPQGSAVVALGDSVAAGVGASNPTAGGYVPRFHRALKSVDCNDGVANACPHLELVTFAKGGATSDTLLAEQLAPAIAEITARSADDDPTNDVEYIAITIGGNDVFQPVLAACSAGVTPECADTITTVFGSYQANLFVILTSLRAAAPDAEIAIMTYYNPLGSCDLAPLAPLGDIVLEGEGVLPVGLNDIIRGVSATVGGVTVVETFGILGDKDYVGGEDCLHPDNSGHRKIANAYIEALG